MSGNKPYAHKPSEFASEFTARIAAHPRVAYYPIPKTDLVVMMVIDELLVSGNTLKKNKSLFGQLDSNAKLVGTVFDSHDDLVQIWRLNKTPGKQKVPDVAFAVWEARKTLAHAEASHIAPNHVIVPSSNFHMCPWGPPEEPPATAVPTGLGSGTAGVRVTVIDAGYVTGGPIDGRLEHEQFGEWFTPAAANPWSIEPMSIGADPLDQNGDCMLDALVGHANFVAGVVAQACPTAKIDIVSHNGSFVEHDALGAAAPIPTEASVARSLWKVLASDPAPDVVNVGFAFPTLPYVPPVGAPAGGPPSWTFQAVLNLTKRSPTLVVAPAGNQNSFLPQFPAAFHVAYPERVIGVGSVTASVMPTGLPTWAKSYFSNYGNWVACCTKGVEVVSSFVTNWNDKPTEEAEDAAPLHPNKTFTGWAKWEGTSFAAPKVAGAIVQAVTASATGFASGLTPYQAWEALIAPRGTGGLDMGKLLDGLPPI